MPALYSKKNRRNAALFERWRGYDASVFEKLGTTREALEAAQGAMQGYWVFPGDPDYNADRMLFNPVFDPFPLAIAYCTTESDVPIAYNIALGAPSFTIRSGGHCTAGFSAGSGVLIDVSNLNSIAIDPDNAIATVGTGCTFGQLNAELGLRGMHVPGGECDDVCIGGYVQGGGYGFTSRTFGMNCDNVLSMRVMLADGRLVTASPTTNRDLWWAMRGGTGGNFGILLSVTYELHALADVWGFSLAWPLFESGGVASAAQALMTLQSEYMLTGPSALTPQVMILGQTTAGYSQLMPWLLIRGVYVGGARQGTQAIAPLLNVPGVVEQYTLTGTYETVNEYLLSQPSAIPETPTTQWPNEDKQARYVARDVTFAEWTSILEFMLTMPLPWTAYMCLEIYGGAINAYPLADSAFIHRDVAFSAFLDVFWLDQSEQGPAEQFLADWCTLMEPMWNGHIYQNYPSLAVPDYRANYWGGAFPALLAVKTKYDPQGFFTFAQSITAPAQGRDPEFTWPSAVVEALREEIAVNGSRQLARA